MMISPFGSMGLVYLSTFYHKIDGLNVGKYSSPIVSYGIYIFVVHFLKVGISINLWPLPLAASCLALGENTDQLPGLPSRHCSSTRNYNVAWGDSLSGSWYDKDGCFFLFGNANAMICQIQMNGTFGKLTLLDGGSNKIVFYYSNLSITNHNFQAVVPFWLTQPGLTFILYWSWTDYWFKNQLNFYIKQNVEETGLHLSLETTTYPPSGSWKITDFYGKYIYKWWLFQPSFVGSGAPYEGVGIVSGSVVSQNVFLVPIAARQALPQF